MSRLHNKDDFTIRRHIVTTAGSPEHLGGYLIGSITISYTHNAATADTINDSASLFLTKGFRAGDVITLSGSTSNDDTYNIVSVTAGTITLESGVVLTTEVEGDSTTITSARRDLQDVDDGVELIIRAHPDNTGYIYIGNSATNATSTSNNNMPLSRNNTTKMQVKHLDNIWVDVATSGNSVIYQYES